MIVTRTTYTFSSPRVGLELRHKSEGLVYENAENQCPQRTIRPKIDPWRTYARFKRLNETAGLKQQISPLTEFSMMSKKYECVQNADS